MNRLMPLEKPLPASGVLRIVNGPHKGKQLRLLGNEITIGRHSDCDIVMKNNKSCSRKHARIIQKNNSYSIESLKKENLVLVNKQPVPVPQILREGDIITLGDIVCVFSENKPLPALISQHQKNQLPKKFNPENISPPKASTSVKKTKVNPRFFIILIVVGVFGFLLLSDNKETTKEDAKKIRTQKAIQEELETTKKINEEEEQTIQEITPSEGEAQIAFIKGFRDYRKGYYHRATKHFNHCLALNRKYDICASYVRQSKKQIERLIQRKMILGKEYRRNRQYKSCISTFRSVEIMIRNTSHILFKEAAENRKFCELKTQNKI